jgi:hypothetical protein
MDIAVDPEVRAEPAVNPPSAVDPALTGRWRPHLLDGAACTALTALALWVGSGLLADPTHRILALNPAGQTLQEWFLAHGTRRYAGDFSLVTHLLNAPDGVNLLTNGALVGPGILLGPLTLTAGAPVSFAVLLVVNLAATALGWYALLRRTLHLDRFAALLGAAFAGYAPGLVAESNARLHLTAQWLVPAIVWCVLRLATQEPAETVRLVRLGALLGVLVTAQYFVGAEVLLLTGVGLLLFCLAYTAASPVRAARAATRVAPGVGVAAAVASMLLAYPLRIQFTGAQSVPDAPFDAAYFAADLASFAALSPFSVTGGAVRPGAVEYTTFFGLPLLLAAAGTAVWLWRRPAALACAVTAVAGCALALGPRLTLRGSVTAIPGPLALATGWPLVGLAMPARFGLAAVPPLAVLIALGAHVARRRPGWGRIAVPLALLLALAPTAPRPLPVRSRPAVPVFFTGGYWRSCVPRDGVLVPVPPADPRNPEAMAWASAVDVAVGQPQGSFIGPYAPGRRASVGVSPRPTSTLLTEVARTGIVAVVTDGDRQAARDDVRYWRASCLVLAHQPDEDALRATTDALFGPGTRVADVTIWRV